MSSRAYQHTYFEEVRRLPPPPAAIKSSINRTFYLCAKPAVSQKSKTKNIPELFLRITRFFYLVMVMFFVSTSTAHSAEDSIRIKDLANFEGVRENLLVGYGLVVGLNGTGDKLNNTAFTEQSLVSFLERLGVNTRGKSLKSKNVAAVTVTATLPPFARQGAHIDVTVSALGDAKSLQGGTLLATPMLGADGEVYAAAQGQLAIGGFTASGGSGSSVTKNIPTRGIIADGAIVEREINFSLNDMDSVNIGLKNPDLTTARNVTDAINKKLGGSSAKLLDSSTVKLFVPAKFTGNVAGLLASIEQLKVSTDQSAKIVIDESSGTVVMGENVKISTVAVAQGNLVVRVDESPQVSQPNAFAPEGAQTVTVPRTDITVDESTGNIAMIENNATLGDLVNGLNTLGVTPRDLITILHNIKAAGALQAEVETR